ncbi:uncharacterized protein DUF4307 [Frondihabitans sp. PhB188]|uniref:DUF4307 domain-containing protein n=1 Tax=Frondihabitans sp. PhB188 TaxID=2485200 RepID=UPI000FB65EEE|nr:DUF4307 domain-containing protein [Frondihabitans sp. PhB188]ROQ38527.1 uncharacterized protein DUF4307 [Frondihabitans sp. PhB188]
MAPTPSTTSERDSRPADSALDRRYGRTRAFRLRRRWIAAIVGGAFVVVFGAWVIFAAFDGTSASIETDDAGYVIHDAHSATVRSEVSVAPGTRVDCAIQVLNSGFDVVGWKVVHFPVSTSQSNTYTTDLNTMNRGVTGLIDKCWLP